MFKKNVYTLHGIHNPSHKLNYRKLKNDIPKIIILLSTDKIQKNAKFENITIIYFKGYKI